MRRILTVVAFSTMLSTFAFADSWSGALLDASCFDRQNQQSKDVEKSADSCAATSQTTTFALHASGKVLKLDSKGNSAANAALKTRADRTEPGKSPSTATNAKVDGTVSGDTIKVDNVEVQ